MEHQTDFLAASLALNELDVLDVDALRLMYRLEMAGEVFYELLAERVGNDEAAVLLRRNGREERGHADRIRRAIGVKLGRDYVPEGTDLERLEVSLPDTIAPELFPAIADGERNGDAGYQRWADNEPDPEVQRLLRLNGREETRHGERVAAVIALLQPS